jgi:hypothetical protein
MPTTVNELSQILQGLLIGDADRLGRETGFIQRQRKFKGSSFAQALVFGWQANPRASLEELCQSARACGVKVSPQGLQERLNEPAAQFLKALLEQSLTYLVEGESSSLQILEQFQGVYLQDSSLIALPRSLAHLWKGNGNQAGISASLKIHTVFEYQQGKLQLSFHSGSAHDSRLQTTRLPQGALRLADSAYFKVAIFQQFNAQAVWWLSRIPAQVGIWQGEQVIPLATWLSQQQTDQLDLTVQLTAQQFTCRLLACRVPEHVAQARRERALADAKEQAHTIRPETLALCEWTVIATNLSPEQLSLDAALLLLRLRWQIELLFKLWKQTNVFSQWRTARPNQILCELFAKLLSVVIQHWLLLLGCWGMPERSLFKAVRVLQKHAFHLATVLTSLPLLTLTLTTILHSLDRCKIQKRKARPSTFQLLARSLP